MLWCRFQLQTKISYGLIEGDTVTAVDGNPFGEHAVTPAKHKLSDVKLLVPVVPPTFYAIGSNYRNHVIGIAKGKGTPPKFYDEPRVGYRANSALIAHGEDIVKPRDSTPVFQYEGELVAVVGKTARNVTPEQARECIFGWTIGNDVSERTWQHKDVTNLRSKNSDTFKPMGPYIATGIDPKEMTTYVRINGETVHTFPTGNMLFDAARVLSDISRYCTLTPGDVLWLGTDEVPKNLVPGDLIEVEITGIGTLGNRVVAEKLP